MKWILLIVSHLVVAALAYSFGLMHGRSAFDADSDARELRRSIAKHEREKKE